MNSSKYTSSNLIAGGLSGGLAATITCPLELVKTRMQSSHARQLKTAHGYPFGLRTAFTLRDIAVNEGYRALWRGLGPFLFGIVPARAIWFASYSAARTELTLLNGGEETSKVHFGAGVIAGLTVQTLMSPIWMVKTRMQLQNVTVTAVTANAASKAAENIPYANSIDCAKRIIREEGFRSLFKGLTASYVGIIESSIQLVLYEKFKRTYKEHKYHTHKQTHQHDLEFSKVLFPPVQTVKFNPLELIALSSSAKTIAVLLTYPHEVVRTRLREQRGGIGQELKYKGFIQTLRTIVIEEGWLAAYGGMGTHLLRVVPNASILFFAYETFIHLLP